MQNAAVKAGTSLWMEHRMYSRPGSEADLDTVIALLDEAIAWLVEQGRPDQWGSQPWSERPETVEFMRKMIAEGDLWLAEIEGQPVGALLLSESPMHYVPPVNERELYIRLLVSSRRHKGAGIGKQLIDYARSIARERGISLVRVDCYSGPDQKLVRFYESAGFTPTQRREVREGVFVQIFEDRLT
jgi:GNAT superfamily N-acetyltransferase